MPIHIWFIRIILERYHEQRPSLINHEISLNAADLSTLMHVKALTSLTSAAIFVL